MAPTATRTSTGHVGGAAQTAVFSKVSNGYKRALNPDGSFQPETYILRSGGNFGGPRVDQTMDNLSFEYISSVIAGPLEAQDYMLSDDSSETELLIVVYWGVTVVPNDVMPKGTRASDMMRERAANLAVERTGSSNADSNSPARQDNLVDAEVDSNLEAHLDGRINAQSANILGYTDEIFRTPPNDPYVKTLQDEIEQDRYYVVLLAYDYKEARKFGMHKLLWETRFSIPEPGNDFGKAFPLMTAIAAKYFGQNSNGLIHHNLGEGHVEVGEPKSLGPVPEK
jgi:hypothetical protein